MARPSKPYEVINGEKKSHRTKAELEQRKNGEEALATGISFKERKEVKNNKIAHKEFKRIESLLENISKNDALYEAVINRYCLLQAEANELEVERCFMMNLIKELKDEFKKLADEMDEETKAEYLLGFTKSINQLYSKVSGLDKTLLSKRKMLLDIEKENIMTVASALRSIPKKVEKEEDDLIKILRGS